MGYTDGRWTQGTSNPDLQLFVGADQFRDSAGLAVLIQGAAGISYYNVPAADACKFISTPDLYLRSGVFATAAYDQEQFGTAAAVPGPSLVAGTSGPLALPGPFPPIPGAQMATVAGSVGGPSVKGLQIDSIDVIYQVLTIAAALATVGVTKTNFANAVAPAVSNIIALGANGLPTAVAAQPTVTNVANLNPTMIQAADSQILLNLNLTAGAGGTIQFYGIVIKAHFNLN